MTSEFAYHVEERDAAYEDEDLAMCLHLDDLLEEHGMHADDRVTCWTCKSWADHGHETGKGYSVNS